MTKQGKAQSKKGSAVVASSEAQEKLMQQLLQDEQARLRKEFEAEKAVMLEQIAALKQKTKATNDDELREKAEQMIQEERLKLAQEKERIQYLAKELHSAMDDLEKQKIEFEEEKRNWVRVIGDLVNDDSVIKEIHKMFEREKEDKKGLRLPSPRVPASSSFN